MVPQFAEIMYRHFPFYHRTYKRIHTQQERLNKINSFYCFVKDVPKWNIALFFPSCMGVTEAYSDSNIGCAIPFIHSGVLVFPPPALLSHQCRCCHSVKRQKCLSIIMETASVWWTHSKGLRDPRSLQATPCGSLGLAILAPTSIGQRT